MEVIQDVTTCRSSYANLVLTIGSFDGVHLGHQKILQTVIERAKSIDGTAALMSLWPHPKVFFNAERPVSLLTDPLQKEALLRELGLDVYFVLPFTHAVATMEPQRFLSEIIKEKCGATRLVVGHDFTFGAGAKGDYNFIRGAGAAMGIDAEMVEPVELEGERVSSTRIRTLVAKGDMEGARKLLGRPYAVAGTVQRGRGLGNGLGYPTANIDPANGILAARGIYAAKVHLDGQQVLGAVSIGIAPTLPHERPVIETHLLDFEGDLTGKRLVIELHHRLRDETKFESVDALIEGIGQDVRNIRRYFSEASA